MKLPEPLTRLYEFGDGCFAEGATFLPAGQVQRQGAKVDATSVRGMLVFGSNGKALAQEQIYCVDVPGFFGTPGAIVRGFVKLKWGWAQRVADDAEAFLAAVAKKTPRGSSIAKDARKNLARAVTAAKKKGKVSVADGLTDVDPDTGSRNLRNDGRTELPWALTHLYSVLGAFEGHGKKVVPFMEVDHTPDAFPEAGRGFVFASDAQARWVVSPGSMAFPEGLVLRVPSAGEVTVHGHLLDVVTAWVEGREVPGEARAAWVERIG